MGVSTFNRMWNGGMEWWNSGMVERWNGGAVEWWNGGLVEWLNRGMVGGASLLNELAARCVVLGPYLLFQKDFQLT